MLSNCRLGTKIALGFGLVIFLFLALSCLSYYQLKVSSDSLVDLRDVELTKLSDYEGIATNALEQTSNIRAYLLTGDESYYQNYLNQAKNNTQLEKELLEVLKKDNLNNQNDQLISELQAFTELDTSFSDTVEQKLYPLIKAGDLTAALEMQTNQVLPLAKELSSEALNNIEQAKANIQAEATDSINQAATATKILIVIGLLALLAAVVIARLLTRAITVPIQKLVTSAGLIADGDLTTSVEIYSNDEIGDIARAFNRMREELNTMVTDILDIVKSVGIGHEELSAASEEIAASADEVAKTVEQLAQGAGKQAESSESTSTLIGTISSNTHLIAGNAETAKGSSQHAADLTRAGVTQADYTVQKIQEIETISKETTEVINELGEQSRQIGEIINVIKGIADQTNLLALNAAIEAARAGEQGRGFAVVAEEVRKLAEMSSESTQEIADLITNIQKKTTSAVESMEKSSQAVNSGVEAVVEAGSAFTSIEEAVQVVVEQTLAALDSLQDLAKSAESAVDEMQDIAAISQESAASTQEISATTEEQSATMQSIAQSIQGLSKKGAELHDLMQRFKI